MCACGWENKRERIDLGWEITDWDINLVIYDGYINADYYPEMVISREICF